MPAAFDLLPFLPGNDEHQAFVYDTFRRSTDHWPWSEMSRPRLMDRLKRELASPGTETRIVTPRDMPGSFLGWCATRRPEVIVFGFTKYSARRQGVFTRALVEMGLEPWTRPLAVTFWTPACARLAAGGTALYFDTRAAFDERGH
jgi:hypothetical protein